jgi:tetratricopeptide (TPR) repeat protein
MGKTDEAKKVMDSAINDPTANALQIHFYARGLQAQGNKEEAMRIFQMNAKLHPNQWPVNWGLARGYSAMGDYKSALKYAKLALPQAPDQVNKDNIAKGITKLESGQDIN